MATPHDPAELDEQIEVAAGRRAPYTQLGDWVALSGISDHAKALYWHLAMHINIQRGDNEVFPSKSTLADWMGFTGKKKDESVDRYIHELVQLGAVEVFKRRVNRMRVRNRYVVHQEPPEEYAGARSLREYYERKREETYVPGCSRVQERAAETPEPPGRDVPVSSRVRTRLETGYVPVSSRVEQDELKNKKQAGSSPTAAEDVSLPACLPADSPKQNNGPESAGARLLRSLNLGTPVTGQVVRQHHQVVTELLDSWPEVALMAHFERQASGGQVGNPMGLLVSVIRDTAPYQRPSATRPGTNRTAALRPACDICGAPEGAGRAERRVSTSDDRKAGAFCECTRAGHVD